ncbi:MAG: hypothetical protein ACHQQ3_13810, partial [Gemmatimonadales bacterium]
ATRLLRGTSSHAGDRALRAALGTTASAYGYSNILLFAPDGRVLMALRPPGRIGPTAHGVIAEAAADSGSVLSNFFRGADTLVHVDVARAVRDAEGRTIAVLALRVSLETYLYPLLG